MADATPRKRSELVPVLIVLALGVPTMFVFARAMADSELRRKETPIRAIIGDQAFELLAAGERSELHYHGRELLAPDFSLPDRHGKPWKLSDHRGQVVVINFWTATCQPCLEEMPSLVQLADLAATRDDLELIAITTDKGWSDVAALLPPNSKLRILFDPDNEVVKGKFGSRLFPETWIIDPDGIVRLRVDGPRDWSGALALEVIESFM